MKIFYKIDGSSVERTTFNSLVNDMLLFHVWETVITKNKEEIEKRNIAISFKLTDGKMHVLTDTQMLFNLNYQVKNEMYKVLKLQSVPIHR